MNNTASGHPELATVEAREVKDGTQLVIVVAMRPCLVWVSHVEEIPSNPRQLRFEYDDGSMSYHLEGDKVHVLYY